LWMSLKTFKAFDDVFGAAAMGTRVVRVMSYSGNLDIGRQALKNVYTNATWNPSAEKIDMLATAPYVGSSLDGSASNVQASFHTEIGSLASGEPLANLNQDKATYNIPAIGTYEGGQTLYTNANVWSANQAIYAEYKYMLDTWASHGVVLFMHYTHAGTWSSGSAWGAEDHIGQAATDAPKLRAIQDWVAAHPVSHPASLQAPVKLHHKKSSK